jgi:hypothetical protein
MEASTILKSSTGVAPHLDERKQAEQRKKAKKLQKENHPPFIGAITSGLRPSKEGKCQSPNPAISAYRRWIKTPGLRTMATF